MDASAHFHRKKITLIGLGLLGRGVGDARFLAECGADLIVTDLKSEAELAESLAALKGFQNISYTLGHHALEDFRGRDLIVKAAGVPLNSPFIEEARKEGTPVRMSADLFAEYAGIPIVGVTGTRGKSTVTHMIQAVLVAAGKKVLLGGNVRGVSTFALLEQVHGDEVAVLELDSWQLQGFGEVKKSPHISVFTTFFPDHLNYYKESPNQYLADKANIFLYQNEHDTLVLGAQAATIVRDTYQDEILSEIVIANEDDVPKDWVLQIPGEHNRYNAGLALAVARTLLIEDVISRKALESFKGVPGRLEFLREVNGVKFYNDTTATTPEATLAALHALGKENVSNLILIMGGADKNLDMNKLLLEIPKRTKRVIMLAGSGTSRICTWLPEASIFDSLSAAVAEAFAFAVSGDIILLSPAFASFGMFKNEYDRGDQFVTLVQAYGN
ncbi:MAG: UDP-N-acetylmuramoyl-L-alanine--D-glutamate ligase [Minisyncoccia bacterium]